MQGGGLKAPRGLLISFSTRWKFPETLCHSVHSKPLGHIQPESMWYGIFFVLDKQKRADLEAFAWTASTKCAWNHHSKERQNTRGLTHLKKKKTLFLKVPKLVGKIILC